MSDIPKYILLILDTNLFKPYTDFLMQNALTEVPNSDIERCYHGVKARQVLTQA